MGKCDSIEKVGYLVLGCFAFKVLYLAFSFIIYLFRLLVGFYRDYGSSDFPNRLILANLENGQL